MIGVIFNFDMRDEPYKQSEVNKGFNALENFAESINEKLFITLGQPRSALFNMTFEEYIIVQHSCNLTQEQKKELVNIVAQIVTVKKTVYKNEQPDKLILFQKISPEDCFVL